MKLSLIIALFFFFTLCSSFYIPQRNHQVQDTKNPTPSCFWFIIKWVPVQVIIQTQGKYIWSFFFLFTLNNYKI